MWVKVKSGLMKNLEKLQSMTALWELGVLSVICLFIKAEDGNKRKT